MRRIIILALYFLIGHGSAMAFSGRFGVECCPSYATNAVYYNQTQPTPNHTGGAIRMHFGGAYHLTLQEHSALSAGLSYALGHIELTHDATECISSINEVYFLRYVWLPILFRFYTSEVMIDTAVYFKLGIIPSINLSTRPTKLHHSGSLAFLKKRPLGCFIVLGGGIKYDFSLTNSLALGLSYCWDLPGVMYRKNSNDNRINCFCHNNFICLDICCLF